jgi:hypothetical protein
MLPPIPEPFCLRQSPFQAGEYDAKGELVGIDIDNASTKTDIHKLVVRRPQRKWR